MCVGMSYVSVVRVRGWVRIRESVPGRQILQPHFELDWELVRGELVHSRMRSLAAVLAVKGINRLK